MRIFIEVGRFLLAALIGAFSVSLLVNLVIPPYLEGVFELTLYIFFPVIIGCVFPGLPLLLLARSIGWDRHLWKLSGLSAVAGLAAGAAIPIMMSFDSAEPLEGFGIVLVFGVPGALCGMIAAQAWFWLHKWDNPVQHA